MNQFSLANLSPIPLSPVPWDLPFGLTWHDLRPCLVRWNGREEGVQSLKSYEKQGLHQGSNSCVVTLRYADFDHNHRETTVFIKRSDDLRDAEAARYDFLTANGVSVPRLLAASQREDHEVIVLEFLPTIGIDFTSTGHVTDFLELIARFTPERRAILDALRDELRQHNYVPILFDRDPPTTRDLTETISTLAHIAHFIVADLTLPRSVPHELQAIVPDLAVPIQPILMTGVDSEYAMFQDFRKYSWVLPLLEYQGAEELLSMLPEKVITPAEAKAEELEQKNLKLGYSEPTDLQPGSPLGQASQVEPSAARTALMVEGVLQSALASMAARIEDVHGTVPPLAARIEDLEHAYRATWRRLEALEVHHLRIDVVFIAGAAFIAGLGVGLAVWIFQ